MKKHLLLTALLLILISSSESQAQDQPDISEAETAYICTSPTPYKSGIPYTELTVTDTTYIGDYPPYFINRRYPAKIGDLILSKDGSYFFTKSEINGKWTKTERTVNFDDNLTDLFDVRQITDTAFPKKSEKKLQLVIGFYLTAKTSSVGEKDLLTCLHLKSNLSNAQ